jgi:basic membrane protein A
VLVALLTGAPAGADLPTEATVCVVADSGGFSNPFAGQALDGAEQAGRMHQVEVLAFAPESEFELEPLLHELVEGEGCDLIIGVGFLVAGASELLVTEYPDQLFSFLDFAYPDAFLNVASVQFRVDQPSFIAGYIAAGISETGAVGIYGGMHIPPVTQFMDGYALGVEYYNDRYGTDVEVLGWDVDTQTGLFTDVFWDPWAGYEVTVELFEAGADTVFAVAGGTGEGSLTAAAEWKAAGQTVRIIEPDYDWYDLFGDDSRILLTSVLKETGVAAHHQVEAFANGTWSPGQVWEDLISEGVGLAKFHKTNDQVPPEIREDLKPLAADIAAGNLLTSPWFPLGPVGSVDNPLTVVLFDWEPAIAEAAILEDALRDLTGLEVAVVVAADPNTPVSYLCALTDSTVGMLTAGQVRMAYDFCGADPVYKAVRFGWDSYWTQFVAARGSGFEGLEDLAGMSWAFSDHGSISSYVVPRGMFNLAGVEVGTQFFTGSHTDAVLAVYNGTADFATSFFSPPRTPGEPWEEGDPPDIPDEYVDDCELIGDEGNEQLWCDGYRVLDPRQMVARELGVADVVEKVEIFMITPGIPNDGLSFGGEMPEDVRSLVEAAFEEMADESSPYYDAFMNSLRAMHSWQGLSPADILDYDWITEVLWAAEE